MTAQFNTPDNSKALPANGTPITSRVIGDKDRNIKSQHKPLNNGNHKPPVPPKPVHLKDISSKFQAKNRALSKDYRKPTYVVTKSSLAQKSYAVGKEVPMRSHNDSQGTSVGKKRYKTLYLFDQLEDAFQALSITVADSLREEHTSSDEESEEINSEEFEERWLDPLENEALNEVDSDKGSILNTSHDLIPPDSAEDSSSVTEKSESPCPDVSLPVASPEDQSRKAFQVAQEVCTSERSYLDTLRLLNVTFRQFVIQRGAVAVGKIERKRDSTTTTIAENTLDHILYTLPNLQTLSDEILKGFENRIQNWESCPKIAGVLIEKAPYLKLFVAYIKDLQKQTNLLEKCGQRHCFFGQCVKEFEASPECLKIPISKHMLVPLQRVVKYKELLKQYLKYSPEGAPDHDEAVQALSIVLEVAEHSNEAIKEWEHMNRLLVLQDRVNGINVSDSQEGVTNTGPLTHVLVEPGRSLIRDGPLMKINRSSTKPVYLILMSDVLLYTSEYQPGNPMSQLKLIDKLPLVGMRIEIPKAAEFQNEFSIISTTRSFALQANTHKERDEWITALVETVDENALRRSSLQLPNTAKYDVPLNTALGKQAPVWIPDNRVTMCQGCTAEFTFTFRRHHCRACGKVVCHICSSFKAPLQYLDYDTARVCQNCFDILRSEFESFEENEESPLMTSTKRSSHTKLKRRFKRGTRENSSNHKAKKPDRLLECTGGDYQSQMCGYLTQLKDRAWVQRWFVLKDKVLYEYRAPADVCALSSTPVLGYELRTEFSIQSSLRHGGIEVNYGRQSKRFFCNGGLFSCFCSSTVDYFEGIDKSKSFILHHRNQPPLVFHAESEDLTERWRTAMEEAVVL